MFYHNNCKKKNMNIRINRSWLKIKIDQNGTPLEIRAEAYAIIDKFIQENIIDKEQTSFMNFLNNMLIDYLIQYKQDISTYCKIIFKKKIKKFI